MADKDKKYDLTYFNGKYITLANSYNFYQDDDENFLVVIKQGSSPAENPFILYDGDQHAILVRNEKTVVILDNVNVNIRKLLLMQDRILVGEYENVDDPNLEELTCEYYAPVVYQEDLYKLCEKIIKRCGGGK